MPLSIIRNDITQMKVDAVVNAANRSLLGGGGVDGAIHRAAGPELLAECRTLNGCGTGQAKITGGYRLPAKYVIHTVGPIWQGGTQGEEKLLRSCYRNSLSLAADRGCESVAFPMISAGAYGYPRDQAMMIAVEEIGGFLLENEMTVYLVVFGRESFITGTKLFRDVAEYIDDSYAETHECRNTEFRRREMWRRDEKAALAYDMTLAEAARKTDSEDARPMSPAPGSAMTESAMPHPDWEALLRRTDEGFADALLRMIDERGMTDAQCYKKANVDRKLFNKIKNQPGYRASKPTACAFALALELSLPEARELIGKAGFSLTRSNRFDIIVEYFLEKRFYDILQINEVLFEYDLPILGSVAV